MQNSLHEWLEGTRIVPVLVIGDVHHALPILHALREGGISMIEVTLRRAAGLGAIKAMLQEISENGLDIKIGAGTVTKPEELESLKEMGAHFAVSPGFLPKLAQKALDIDLPYLPGVQTISEMMQAREMGYSLCKFFPAEAAGGVAMMKAVAGPFPDLHFCPTGGITLDKIPAYLVQPNVLAVGVTALTPPELIAAQKWEEITKRSQTALAGGIR